MTLEGTNTWVLAVSGGVVVVDPGPLLEPHLASIAALGPVLLTVLTHGHADHASGASRFAALTGSPVTAYDPRLCSGAPPLSSGPLDVPGLALTVVPTPGHTSDSVCLVASRDAETVVLTGDTMLGRGSTVVSHPDGRLADYLASLSVLEGLGPLPVLPGHGPVLPSIADAARELLAHRAMRLVEVQAARAAGAVSVGAVVEAVYPDLAPALRPAAELSVRAQLDYLDAP